MSIAAILFAHQHAPRISSSGRLAGGYGESCPGAMPSAGARANWREPTGEPDMPDEDSAPKPGHFLPGGAGVGRCRVGPARRHSQTRSTG